jgi:hypothetical protein
MAPHRFELLFPLRGRWLRYLLIGAAVAAVALFAPVVERPIGDCCISLVSLWDVLHGR